ncbi:protein LEO1 homolog [Vicia villosa]|uniref:protein LEO1 homolog n=1 Tax=Vicia villosa TaxID=3911 RepID=UPI00273B6E74|nr:protein LEO1 homolog [Vicia villosa]
METKDKPLGSSLELEILLRKPPALPNKIDLIKVSNIMGVDPKPFDTKTYEEEDTFVIDELGNKKRIRLENNIKIYMLNVQYGILVSAALHNLFCSKKYCSRSCESNARFVRWSDDYVYLLTGNPAITRKVIEESEIYAIFLVLEFSSVVDSRQRKVYKVKNCAIDIDPEREKEEKEKDDEADYYNSRRKRHFEDELEVGLFMEMKHKSLDLKGKVKRKGFESDEKSPPRKPSTNRRMTVMSDSDDD